ncbi:TPA: hypothetical protein ACOEMK_003678, partial [Enterobacter kobei]
MHTAYLPRQLPLWQQYHGLPISQRKASFGRTQKTKNPAGARFLSGFCGWSPQNTLCYVNAKSIRDRGRTRNSGTDFDVFEYGSPFDFCPK